MPFVQQLEAADCAAACLAMVLGYWNRETTLDEAREAVGASAAGTTAHALLEAAGRFGLAGRGLRVGLDRLHEQPTGSILHWEFNHFVVLDRCSKHGLRIVDPATGPRMITWAELDRSFTGVVLALRPNADLPPVTRRSHSIAPYLRRLFSDSRLFGRVMTMSLLLQLIAMVIPAVIGVVVDRVIPRSDVDLLVVMMVGACGALAFGWIAALLRGHLLVDLRAKLDHRMTVDFVTHLTSLPYAFYQRRSAGDLMMRVNSNAVVRDFLASNVLSAGLDATLVSGYLVLMMFLSRGVTVLVLGLGLARVAVMVAVRGRLRESMSAQLDAQARSQAYLGQMVAAVETLKTAGAERRAVAHWSNLYTAELNQVAERGRLNAWIDAALQGMSTLSPLLVLAWGAARVLDGSHSLGTVLAISALAAAFFGPLTTLVQSALQLSTVTGYLERMDDVLLATPERARRCSAAVPRLRGAIAIRDLTFRHRSDGPAAVDEVSLEIAPGQLVAVVGASGSGKSTLARLLLGLHRPSSGQILFDGKDLGELDPGELRRQIGVVPQHPFIFAATVRENIVLTDPTASLHRVMEAARTAQVHDDVMALPMQYDTPVAERGESLSGGQRQRLALARAILHRPPIIILDEATSALDARVEMSVARNLDRLHCTRVVIAHRLSTVVRADLIVVMHEGRIIERGTHRELMAHGRHYADLVASQAALSGA